MPHFSDVQYRMRVLESLCAGHRMTTRSMKPCKPKTTIAADKAALPQIPAELLEQLEQLHGASALRMVQRGTPITLSEIDCPELTTLSVLC